MNCSPPQLFPSAVPCCAVAPKAARFALRLCSPPPLFFVTDGARGVLLAFRCPEEQVRRGQNLGGLPHRNLPSVCIPACSGAESAAKLSGALAIACVCALAFVGCAGLPTVHCPLSAISPPPVLQPSYGSVSAFLRHAKLSYWLQGVRVRVQPTCVACKSMLPGKWQ